MIPLSGSITGRCRGEFIGRKTREQGKGDSGLTLCFLMIPFRQLSEMFHGAGIPDDLLFQPVAGEFGAQTAELHVVLPRAFVDGTAAGFLPFRNVPVRFDAARTLALPELSASVAALTARGDPGEIDLFQDKNSCDK